MKASELRIGNYVYYQNLPYSNKKKVAEILPGDISACAGSSEENYTAIPLTKEWPARLGLSLYNEACDGNEYEIYIDDHTTFNVIIYKYSQDKFPANAYMKRWGDIMNLRKIQHVHQLQNLYFALAGEELIIKP